MKEVTLLFLRRENEILLALKKRGFGTGKWNGVGGKIEPGESIEEATIRECQEEINVSPNELRKIGEIEFKQPIDGVASTMNVHVFVSDHWTGEPSESEEMAPQWFTLDAIPYDQMWPDDEYWLPLLIQETKFTAYFELNDADVIVDHKINQQSTNLT